MVIANLARLYIWWQAFREKPKARSAGERLTQMKSSHASPHGCFRVLGGMR